MKKILFVATGGTIASKKTENGLTPQITPEELISYIPEVEKICEITAVQPFNLDSSNVVPENWSMLVKVIREHYDAFDGFIIAHGTDTMAYTAAALSYMIQNSEKPIVITGAQRPINLDITDAKTNLSDSFYYACDDASQGVQIVFDGKVIAGTRAKKVRTKSYNAFSSIDFPYLAVIQDRRILRYLPMLPYEKPVRFYENLSDNVFLLKLIPGISPVLLPAIFEHYDAIIVESFGVGLMALAVLVMLLRWARGKSWWPGGRAVLYGLLAVCMAGSVVWQRAATRSAYDQGGRAYTVFGDGVAAGLAADCGDTPVVTDYMIWGGHEVAENAFFLRYGDLDADAHALQVWRTEDHADDEAVYRVGFTLGQDRHYDIAWCGLGHGADPDVLTDVEVWLPAGTFLYDVLYYTTADGEEVRREVYPDKNGTMITLDGEILADSIRLAAH